MENRQRARVPEEAIARIIEGLRESLIKAPEPKLTTSSPGDRVSTEAH